MTTIWKEDTLREWFRNTPDVTIQHHSLAGGEPILLLYCSHLCDGQQLYESVIPALHSSTYTPIPFIPALHLEPFLEEITAAGLSRAVFSGKVVLFWGAGASAFTLNLSNAPKRSPEESSLDISIRGPRDGFVEDFDTNLALIRKRLRTESLVLEPFTIGTRSATRVGLLYLDDVTNKDTIEVVRSRIQRIHVDTLVSTEQLEEYIKEQGFTFFPTVLYTGRPDFAVDCLSRGRFALIVEGMPAVMIAPATLFLILKSSEDNFFPFWIAGVGRAIRLMGLLISMLLPGFWIALTSFNQDQLPFPLLATITQTRIGLPLPATIEFFMILFILELFREGGNRLPRAIGQTLAVVGGIVIGDAAVRAALISPSLIVIGGLSSIATATISNMALSGGATYLRFLIFFASAILGMYGFILACIYTILHLVTIESFGLPYMSPASPFSKNDLMKGLLSKSWREIDKRPGSLHTQDNTRKGHDKL
ncbi:spore germination protein [Paenibacillus rigui]|uniref:Spore germination protein n=1 Tax=Paenibacillus rigui TaxID=554312 RepID=A0A229UUE5_9BACL|nr:spore germination protein [Paenibacillus rigui]OXM86963.1 spore germination protein [Paenibacillus rigui]